MIIFQFMNKLSIIESLFYIVITFAGWWLFCTLSCKLGFKRVLRIVSGILFLVWSYYALEYTVFGRVVGERELSLIPFNQLYQIIVNGNRSLPQSAWMNIVLFIPFGLLLSETLLDQEHGYKYRSIIIGCAGLMSLGIELCQGIWGLGLLETDDVMCNTIGAGVGVLLYTVKSKC